MEGWANPEVFPGGGETGAESYGLEESEKVTWRRKEGGSKPSDHDSRPRAVNPVPGWASLDWKKSRLFWPDPDLLPFPRHPL